MASGAIERIASSLQDIQMNGIYIPNDYYKPYSKFPSFELLDDSPDPIGHVVNNRMIQTDL